MISSVRASLPNIATAKQLHKNDGASRRRGERPRATPCMARSLRGALHALAAAALLVAVVGLAHCGAPGRLDRRVQVGAQLALLHLVAHHNVRLGGQHALELAQLLGRDLGGVREGDLELHEEVAAAVLAGAADGHALVVDAHGLVGLDHHALGALDAELGAVQARAHEVDAREGLAQGDGLLHDEVRALALVERVRLLVDDENDVARLTAVRRLVRLARERDLVALLHAALDEDLQHLAVAHDLLAAAAAALVGVRDDHALAVAGGADGLRLLDHARAHLPDGELDAPPAAVAARLRCRAVLAAAATAVGAEHVARDGQLDGAALVEVLERDLERMLMRLALLRAPPPAAAAAAKECAEHVLRAAPTLLVHAVRAVLVVPLALLGVAQHLVRHCDLLEQRLVAALVRVLLGRNLHEGLLDVLGCRVLGHAQRLIVRIRVHLLRLIGLAAHAPKGETSATEKHAST
mmetsp:Transcript_31547/g.87983  ORF Transcript_31547/g.87983 Transcript_31547/m.87983 type:complete len:466 (-) Transcript_31547:12-1409(-)